MISNLPSYINIVFILTTFLTIYLFYRATKLAVLTLIIIGMWILFQAIPGYNGFYTNTDAMPPRLPLMAGPALLFIAGLFITGSGRKFLDSLDEKALTLVHIVRVPVEICLYWLFRYKSIPQLMTFEGRNLDILAGFTAPVIYYFGYVKNKLNRPILLTWNFICLGLLLNIVVNAILAVPSPFQQFAFEQPNTGILYFPFVWLPACVVPLVLLAHLASIRKLLLNK